MGKLRVGVYGAGRGVSLAKLFMLFDDRAVLIFTLTCDTIKKIEER